MNEILKEVVLGPQKGNQEKYLASPADIVIYGGHAGCGKSYGTVLEAARNIGNSEYRAIIFRQSYKQLTMAGGLWDKTWEIYPHLDGEGTSGNLLWQFPTGAEISLSYLDSEADKYVYQGAGFCFIGFDELTHFSETQFFYMLGRNRSTCGVRPYVRATCNPDADSWVAKFIEWWIDQKTGLAIPERSGVIRYFLRRNDQIVWASTRAELAAAHPEDANDIKSFTFIVGFLEDNPVLMQKDPGYLGNLKLLDMVERERQLGGNWKIQYTAGTMFQKHWFGVVGSAPAKATRVRMWDLAGTSADENKNADETASIKLAKSDIGLYFVEDCFSRKISEHDVEKTILSTAQQDGKNVDIGIFQDPGQAGKSQARRIARMLAGYNVHIITANKDTGKIIMAKPVSSQAEARNIFMVRASWNDLFVTRMCAFPKGKLKDIVDALSGAFKLLTEAQGEWASGDC